MSTDSSLYLTDDNKRIIQTLLNRKAAEYVPEESPSDGHKIALVIEGGGMAGVITGALVTAIRDLGLIHYVDAIYASSAGAAAAAHLLADTPEIATMDYVEDFVDGRFLSISRAFRYAMRHMLGWEQTEPPGMDPNITSGIWRGTVNPEKILDVQKVLDHKVPLHIIVSDIDDMQTKVVSNFKSCEEFLLYLSAGCLVPGVAGQPIIGTTGDTEGHRLVDGKTTRVSPVQICLDAGYDMALVLTSRCEGSSLKNKGVKAASMDWIITQFCRLVEKDWASGSRLVKFSRDNARENDEEVKRAMNDPRVIFLGLPPDYPRVSSACMDPEILREAAVVAYKRAIQVLSLGTQEPTVPPRWHWPKHSVHAFC